jgi:argininosuccinate lyase
VTSDKSDLYGTVPEGEFYRRTGVRLIEDPVQEQREKKIGSEEAVRPLLPYYHRFDKAHLVMLGEEGIVPPEDAAVCLQALRDMEAEGIEATRRKGSHGMHSGEAYLIRELGEEVGGRIHLGRSSGDLSVVATRAKTRDQLLDLMEAVLGLRETLLERAAEHADTVMPGYTMYQHAQPLTFGHMLVWWEHTMARNFVRLRQTYERTNRSPAGAAMLTGSDFPLDRERTATLLGFDGVIENTLDAVLGKDYGMDAYSALASIMATLGEMGHPLFLFTTYEFRLLDYPDRLCGTSSIFPQKRNPHVLMKPIGDVQRVFGDLTSHLVELRNVAGGGYCGGGATLGGLRDTFDRVVDAVDVMERTVDAVEVNKERARDLAGVNWGQAADLAGMLVRERGVAWRSAHQIAGIVVRQGVEREIHPEELTVEHLDDAVEAYLGERFGIDQELLDEAMDPVANVEARTLTGGPAPEEVTRQIAASRQQLDEDRDVPENRRAELRRARELLERAIDDLIDEHRS